ncbi:hypothetical protein DRH13_04685 [Candidatus Woesebacteria bacterium]|nr:MAG: hypothetical protein DRH13_04685 [Candidatus Woesebacteria bacterium]
MTWERRLLWILLILAVVVGIIIGAVSLTKWIRKEIQMATGPAEVIIAAALPTAIPDPAEEKKDEPAESALAEVVSTAGEKPAEEFFQTPVEATDVFNEESSWLIAEPGVILDDTAAWVIPSVKAEHYVNIPEGGFTYFSLGEGIITVDGVSLVLPGTEGLNYLVLIRGRIDDTIVDSDLNLTATVVDFVPGHAIWSIMPPGAYVSKGWFGQQLVMSTTTGGTNCGATGCTTVHVVLFDVDSHFYQKYEVKADNLDSWKLLESN